MLSTAADHAPPPPYPEQPVGQQLPFDLPPANRTVIRTYPMPWTILQILCQLVPALAAVPPTHTVPMLRFDHHNKQPMQSTLSSTIHEPLRLMLYRTQKQYIDGGSEDPDHAPELLLADSTPLLLSFCFTTPFSTTTMAHGSAMPDEIRVASAVSSIDQRIAATGTVYKWCVDELRAIGYQEPWDPDTAIVPTRWDLLGEIGFHRMSSKNPAGFLHLGSAAQLSSEALLALADLIPDLCQTQPSWTDTYVWISAEYPVSVHIYRSTTTNATALGWVTEKPRSLDSRRIATATFVSPIMALLDRGPKTRLATFVASLTLPPENRIPTVEAANNASRVYRWAVGVVRAAGGHLQCEPAVQETIDEAVLAQFALHVATIQRLHLFS
ncbi:hypothetical protein BC828DRAFT_300702 [Blastocladiella britannica]|nr:hypothetical protein BC828DRAFT_300702 [Blastocladiella britannica]